MIEYEAVKNINRCPSHPGAVLDDLIKDFDFSKKQIAELLGISRQQLYDILNEKKPVSPKVAGRIGKLLGNGSGIWLRLQANHDAWHADRETMLKDIQTLEHA